MLTCEWAVACSHASANTSGRIAVTSQMLSGCVSCSLEAIYFQLCPLAPTNIFKSVPSRDSTMRKNRSRESFCLPESNVLLSFQELKLKFVLTDSSKVFRGVTQSINWPISVLCSVISLACFIVKVEMFFLFDVGSFIKNGKKTVTQLLLNLLALSM